MESDPVPEEMPKFRPICLNNIVALERGTSVPARKEEGQTDTYQLLPLLLDYTIPCDLLDKKMCIEFISAAASKSKTAS